MKIGIIIETKDYEKSWNGMRFALTAEKSGHEVKVFPRFYVSTSKSIIKALINMRSFEIQLSPIG
jgi:peroxiredoxin family protein